MKRIYEIDANVNTLHTSSIEDALNNHFASPGNFKVTELVDNRLCHRCARVIFWVPELKELDMEISVDTIKDYFDAIATLTVFKNKINEVVRYAKGMGK